MSKTTLIACATATALAFATTPVMAQDIDGDAGPFAQWARKYAPPGTFWLDGADDVEIIRYTTARDVSLCLPEPEGVGSADSGIPLQITWDNQNSVVLRPGNCFFFDARTVKVKPAKALPRNVVLRGRVQTSSAVQRGDR